MFRTLVMALLVATLLLARPFTPAISAQEWAKKMFLKHNDSLYHNFGVVAKGAKAEYEFEFENIYVEDVHIAGVRSSCGCTEPQITQKLVKTFEKGAIRAVFNTRSFAGSRSATLTVIIDKPFYAEVQLSVRGYIRNDVLFTPGSVSFGDISFGQSAEQEVKVSHSGSSRWQIVDVRSANPHFEVELSNKAAGGGRSFYTMKVRLKGDAPVGYLQDQLTIVTNDSYNSSLELNVDGRVVSPLSVSPASLLVGVLKSGDVAKKQLFVRAKQPFRILRIDCPDESFQFTIPDSAKANHLVPVTFTAGPSPGKISHKIEITTDVGVASCMVTATVIEPVSSDETPQESPVDL